MNFKIFLAGMKRELIKLIGGVPTLVSLDTRRLGKADSFQKWEWTTFENSARSDRLKLHHWQKIEDGGKDYEYAKNNFKIDIVEFSQEEYNTLIKPNDTNWTYEETMYLWDLLTRFDLRFTIVHDRYDEQIYQERTVEELKDRYYSICRKILESRKMFDHPILKSGYNYEQEMKRRSYIERTMNRSPEEANEENNLIKQADIIEKKIEKYEKVENSIKNFHLDAQPHEPMTFEDYIKQNATENDSFVYLRSQKMKHNLPVSEKIQHKVESFMKELNLPEPLIPTARVEMAYDTLRNNMVLYSSLKKYLDKKEKEHSLLTARLKELQSKKQSSTIASSVISKDSHIQKTEQSFDAMSANSTGVREKKKIKNGTPIKPRKRKNNTEEDSAENSLPKKKKKTQK